MIEFASVTGAVTVVQAQGYGVCRDPWVTGAIGEVMGRPPNGSGEDGECNIYRYGGGHWDSYPDLVDKVRRAFGVATDSGYGVCRDPWVTGAIGEVMGRPPYGSGEDGECNIYRYGDGHWDDYPDLVDKVRRSFNR
jgi:hypothetical protein